jgi:hypothetical protein
MDAFKFNGIELAKMGKHGILQSGTIRVGTRHYEINLACMRKNFPFGFRFQSPIFKETVKKNFSRFIKGFAL